MLRHWLPVCVVLGGCAIDEDLSDHDGFDDTIDDGKADAAEASTPAVHRFRDQQLFPEGGAFDPVERAFFVGSLRRGKALRRTRRAAPGPTR